MNLLDKYVAEVAKDLPRKNRADIESEIRSTLQDMLDERATRAGRPADDAMVRELLKEYGAPAKVAASYHPAQYLIGPRLFPTFVLVTRIVLSVVLGGSLVGFALGFMNHSSGPEFMRELGKFALQLASGLITAFGNLVLVFAILERVVPAARLERESEEEWSPDDLESEPDPAQVKPAESIFAILFMAIGLLILNVYPDLIGLGFVSGGKWTAVPALSEAFFRYLPWINLLALLQIGLQLFLLRAGHWQTLTRLADLALEAGGIVLAGFMLAGPSLVDLSAEKLVNTPLAEASAQLVPILNALPALVLTILIVISAVEVGKTAYRMLSRPATLFPAR